MEVSAKSSMESQNTSLSKGVESCCAFLSRKSNRYLDDECMRRAKELSERESPRIGASDAAGFGLQLISTERGNRHRSSAGSGSNRSIRMPDLISIY
jgi:hypothetical protein